MPALDRTGPLGQGERTGRGQGPCNSNDRPGYQPAGYYGNPTRGLGRGLGPGGRRKTGGGRGRPRAAGPFSWPGFHLGPP